MKSRGQCFFGTFKSCVFFFFFSFLIVTWAGIPTFKPQSTSSMVNKTTTNTQLYKLHTHTHDQKKKKKLVFTLLLSSCLKKRFSLLQWSRQIFCLFAFFQWNSMKWSGGSNITAAKHRAWPQTHRDQRKHNSDYNENKAEKKEAAAHSFATDKESTWIVSHDLVLLLLSMCVCSFFLLRILPDSFLTFTSCKRLTKKKKRKSAQSIMR